MSLDAPFPYFGGKRSVADQVWAALGEVEHYIEPFFGSGAVLLQRPHPAGLETVNDMDGMIANFWRAVKHAPDAVAEWADWPCHEADLHARHLWLNGQRADMTAQLMGDSEWHDAKVAGWWLWGACNWIASGWCSGNGPWIAVDGVLSDSRKLADAPPQGIKRKLPHLFRGRGINRQIPHLSFGQGINHKRPDKASRRQFIAGWMGDLQARLGEVRIACGDWSRVTGPSVRRAGGGITGMFFDPPYDQAMRATCYTMETPCAAEVLAWCADNGHDPALRIVLAGYDGEHNRLEDMGWRAAAWKTQGGYARQGDTRGRDNASLERLWFSPHCLGVAPDLLSLMDG